jgi:hypothetical protein
LLHGKDATAPPEPANELITPVNGPAMDRPGEKSDLLAAQYRDFPAKESESSAGGLAGSITIGGVNDPLANGDAGDGTTPSWSPWQMLRQLFRRR